MLIEMCVYFCTPGVFSVSGRDGAIRMFRNVANPRLYLAVNNGNLLGTVCTDLMYQSTSSVHYSSQCIIPCCAGRRESNFEKRCETCSA